MAPIEEEPTMAPVAEEPVSENVMRRDGCILRLYLFIVCLHDTQFLLSHTFSLYQSIQTLLPTLEPTKEPSKLPTLDPVSLFSGVCCSVLVTSLLLLILL